MLSSGIFAINFSLLLVHEMDAIRHREWKMFVGLKDMEEGRAYRIFLLLHVPLYALVLLGILCGATRLAFISVDVFLILHEALHIGFRHNPANELNGVLSRVLIHAMGVLAAVHLIALLLI